MFFHFLPCLLSWTARSLLQRCVSFYDRDEVRNGTVGVGTLMADRQVFPWATNGFSNSNCRAGRCRNDGHCAPSPSKVRMRKVQDPLIVRITVHRHHETFVYSDIIIQDLHNRRKAFCRTWTVGNNMIFFRIIIIFIDAQYKRLYIRTFAWSAYDDFFRSGLQMLSRPALSVKIRTLRTTSTPRSSMVEHRIFLGKDFDLFSSTMMWSLS